MSSGLYQGGASGSDGKWLWSGYILKAKLKIFANLKNVGCGRQ